MADSEEFRLKRLKHEEQMSRMFDEVMGLGEFADSSRGSVASSKSGGQVEPKGLDETLQQGETQPLEEDSNSSRQEKKTNEETGETSFAPLILSSSGKPSSFDMVRSERGGGGSGGAAFDDALDGLPSYGPEEEDEDWHYALPMGSLEDVDVGKASKISQLGREESASRGNPFPRKPEAEEEQENEGSTESANTSHSSQDNIKDDGGLNQTEETEDSQQEEASGNTQGGDRNPPASPRINIKDEPIDEGYDAALLPQNSSRQIKEELEQHEEELRISSVYSVGGGNSFTSSALPAAVPAPTPTHILIPGRGAILQAMASLPVRPPVPVPPTVPTLTAFPPLPPCPPPPAVPGSVRCSGCSKVLLKGQTAFQRKGSTQLFCSTVCLTGHLPPVTKGRSCFQCNREIAQPRDMVTVPAENSTFMLFCGQFCLSVHRHKKKQGEKVITDKRPERKPEKPPEKPVEGPSEKPFCSVCKATNKQIEHEVTHQGKLHRLCSDPCFLTWRKLRQLALNCCEGCGLYCNSNSGSCHMLTIEKSQLNFCSSTCIGTFKQTCRKSTECANCRKITVVSSTIMERDQKGKVQLYCSPACVEQSRPPQHNLTGTPFPCGLCKVFAVPQYHLAMVDGTIRNFCSLTCVNTFRKSSPSSQPDLTNGTSSLRDPPSKDAAKPGPSTAATGATSVPPIPQDYSSSVPHPGHNSSHTSVPPLVPPHSAVSTPTLPGQTQARSPPEQPLKPVEDGLSEVTKLTCYQCSKQFSNKPLLLTHQGRISLFCSKACCDQYNTQKNVLTVCDCCKEEKILYEVTSFGQQDVFFCSENCKQFFKQERALRPCSYCCGLGQRMMLSHYGGKIEEFCKPHCMSQYTVLYYGMGRCNSCRKQGYMNEKLQCLGSVCNFCNMACLLQYCHLHFETSQHTTSSNGTNTAPPVPSAPAQPHHSSKMNPVIADVVSLANGSASQPSGSANTALTGELPTSNIDGKNLDHASTQTDAMRAPAPRRRQMKNKSVLCRPFTTDQEIMCQLPSSSPESKDSSSQSDQPSRSPAHSPKLQGETEPSNLTPARLTGRHFLGKRDTDSNCKVCAQRRKSKLDEEEPDQKKRRMEDGDDELEKKQEISVNEERNDDDEEEWKSELDCGRMKRQTPYYCKTCTEEPTLCPVPCFELYHTKRDYEAPAAAKEENIKVFMVPVPVPVFVPMPMNMYSQHAPVPMVVPMPIPVPIIVQPQSREVKDAAVQMEKCDEEEEKRENKSAFTVDQSSSSYSGEVKNEVREELGHGATQTDLFQTESSERRTEPVGHEFDNQPKTIINHSTSSAEEPPSSPVMDLEADLQPESLNQNLSVRRRGVKRTRVGSCSRKRGRRRTGSAVRSVSVSPASSKLNHLYGVKAWRSWVQQSNKEPTESSRGVFKEDILQCSSAELSFALSRFIKEVQRPNGEPYSPDSIFYLCLGIQQYLFMQGRIENIFTDELYSQFASEISKMLQLWKPKPQPSGGIVPSRVEESYLWECKQLGAYSPIVLLHTLLFFCTKNLHLTTLAEHQHLSFSNFTRRFKPFSAAGNVCYLQYERSRRETSDSEQKEQLRKHPAGRDGEMLENAANPLQCPVRLYEFYLSRCPESAKNQSGVFYLQPQRNVHTYRSGSCWYTSKPLDATTLQSMLSRILAVREVQEEHERLAATKGLSHSSV